MVFLVTTILMQIGELIPLEAPKNLTLLRFDDGDALITWEPIRNESVRGTFRGYIIRIWNNRLSQVYAVPPEVTKTSVQFFPYSKNFVTVSVRNDKYVGPRSVAISFDAPQIEPGMPFTFTYYQLGSHSTLLRWNRPGNPNGVLLGYNVYCSEATDNGINDKTTVHEFIQGQGPENTQAKLTGLKWGQKYQIEIAAVNCAGEGERNTLLVEIEPHQPYQPSTPTFDYYIDYVQLTKTAFFFEECSKPRYGYLPHLKIDHMDNFTYSLNSSKSSTKTPPHGVAAVAKPCLVTTLIKWIPDVDNNAGEHFYVKYRLKGDKEWTETLPEMSEDFILINNFNACRSYEIVLVAIDGEFKTESEVKETPAVLFIF